MYKMYIKGMGKMNIIEKIANHGFFSLKTCAEHGVSRYDIASLEKKGLIRKIRHGVYAFPNTIDDEFFIPQLTNKLIYSHDTALYLTGYSDLIPEQNTIMVPYGVHSKALWQEFRVRQTPIEIFERGVVQINSYCGNPIRVYCIERTLCDLIHSRTEFSKERFIPAIQKYISKNRDVGKIIEYAQMLNVEKKIRPYLEALL